MSPKILPSSRHSVESCTLQLHSWKPFHLPQTPTSTNPVKRPCFSDRTTSFSIESIDMSGLSLFDDLSVSPHKNLRFLARKRRRKGSRSVSGRSSDRSETRRRCCSVGANGTCSDFNVVVGTDSSGEMFVNGDASWGSDTSEAVNGRGMSKKERDGAGVEREVVNGNNVDAQGNESGYGSEPGYRGDVELGYGDEIDEEEDDSRPLFLDKRFGDTYSNLKMVGDTSLQKGHHRCRRKKQDLRMVDAI